MTTTPWYPARTSPVHIGWYEVRYSTDTEHEIDLHRLFWDGDHWTYGSYFLGVSLFANGDSCFDSEYWRGLTECAA